MTWHSFVFRHTAVERQHVLNDIKKYACPPRHRHVVHTELTCFPQHPIEFTILSAFIAIHSDISENKACLPKTTPKTQISYSAFK